MPRIELLNPETTNGEKKEILSQIHEAFGTPNMFKAIANSTPALKMMWSAFGAFGSGKLGAQLGEQIAIAVANFNRCEYSSLLIQLGKGAGLTEIMGQAQIGNSNNPKTQAALTFALKLVKERANVSPTISLHFKKVGYSEENIAEIFSHLLNIFLIIRT